MKSILRVNKIKLPFYKSRGFREIQKGEVPSWIEIIPLLDEVIVAGEYQSDITAFYAGYVFSDKVFPLSETTDGVHIRNSEWFRLPDGKLAVYVHSGEELPPLPLTKEEEILRQEEEKRAEEERKKAEEEEILRRKEEERRRKESNLAEWKKDLEAYRNALQAELDRVNLALTSSEYEIVKETFWNKKFQCCDED